MKIKNLLLLLIFILILLSCDNKKDKNLNEIPMYGNIEKTKSQIEADKKFLDNLKKDYTGNLDKAFKEIIFSAWNYLNKEETKLAIRRFNQAWLLDRDNYEVYWGFGSYLLRIRKFDESIKMFEIAYEKESRNARLICDYAGALGEKGFEDVENKKVKISYYNRAIKLLEEAEEIEGSFARIYLNKSILLFYLVNYEDSFANLEKAKFYKIDPKEIPGEFALELEKKLSKANTEDSLLIKAVKKVFIDHKEENQIKDIVSNGIWSNKKNVIVVSGNVADTKFIYAFMKISEEYKALKLFSFDKEEPNYKLGYKLSYYDRFEVIPSIGEMFDNIHVGYTMHTWKNGQRYTYHSKDIIIKKDGSLDWSQF